MGEREEDGFRVLILAPRGRDAILTGDLLQRAGIGAHVCSDVDAICSAMDEGAAAALIAEEALGPRQVRRLADHLRAQPPWSDFPIFVFASRSHEDVEGAVAQLDALGNVSVLDRPVKVRTMISAVRGAIRARSRQYEARRAIRSRDEFLAMLGHELRNPLGVVMMAVDLMGRSDPSKRERQREIISRQATHLSRLVDDLLDHARVTHGKVTLRSTTIDLAEVVRTAFQVHEPSATSSDHQYSLSVTPNLFVLGDRVRLEQVFSNLLTNAIKYTPAGGIIRVEAERVGGSAVVRVIDGGIGIDSEMLGKVFDAFAQADQGLARSRGGMGLGLTVVRDLVQLHGGEVAAESDGPGKGSRFTVRLPLHAPAVVGSPKSNGTSREARKRIVVVEDSEDLRDLLEELLFRRGHEVLSADSGPEGVERILEARPELALVDIGLPGFDGLELARRVRAAGCKDTVLVALTGYGQEEDRRRSREAGFDAHVTKPVDGHAVDQALRATRA